MLPHSQAGAGGVDLELPSPIPLKRVSALLAYALPSFLHFTGLLPKTCRLELAKEFSRPGGFCQPTLISTSATRNCQRVEA